MNTSLQHVFAGQWSVLHIDATVRDGTMVWLVPMPSACRKESSVSEEAYAVGARAFLTVRSIGHYRLCGGDKRSSQALGVRVVVLQPPKARCPATFGSLCPAEGTQPLSAADFALAHISGIKVFLYDNVDPAFHRELYESSVPSLIRAEPVWLPLSHGWCSTTVIDHFRAYTVRFCPISVRCTAYNVAHGRETSPSKKGPRWTDKEGYGAQLLWSLVSPT